MSTKYKFKNSDGRYFISFSTLECIDVFTRKGYKDILVENLRYCQNEKGLEVFAWCIMTNHVHLIARVKEGYLLQDIIRDFKKHTSKVMIKTISGIAKESRKAWMLELFGRAGKKNSGNKDYQSWRQDNHPIEVWSEDAINQKLLYLHYNLVVGGSVDKAQEYLTAVPGTIIMIKIADYLKLYLFRNDDRKMQAQVAKPRQPNCLCKTRASREMHNNINLHFCNYMMGKPLLLSEIKLMKLRNYFDG